MNVGVNASLIPGKMNRKKFVAKLAARDGSAWERFVREYGALIWSISGKLGLNDSERDDHFQGLLGCVCPFQSQTEEIHTGQTRLFTVRFAGEDGLVPDSDGMLVDAHLGPPHPKWPGKQNRVCLFGLWDRDVRTGELRFRRMPAAGYVAQYLGLIGFPITVLRQDGASISGSIFQSDQCVTHC